MHVTEVRVTLRDDGKLRAFASITLDNAFVIRGLKVIEGNSGLFVAMPSRRREDGTYQDIAHPITNAARDKVEAAVLAMYQELRRHAEEGGEGFEGAGVPSPLLPPIGPLFSAMMRAIPRADDHIRGPGVA